VADSDNNSIRKVTPAGVVTTLAGGAGPGSRDGVGSDATFNAPAAVAVDSAGNVYVTDYGNATLRKVTPTRSVTTLAGSPGIGGWTDDSGEAARHSTPNGITVSGDNTLYFADVYNNTIRKAVPAP
jgi:serine/threonine protein kinase, bacterial